MGHTSPKTSEHGRRAGGLFGDERRFLRTLFESPRLTGAVAPSGRFLARAMAKPIDPAGKGLIVELGPGTGPVTSALLKRGVKSDRLVLVDDARQLLPGQFAQFRLGQGIQHFAPPLGGAQVHDAGGRRRRDADHVEVAGQVAGRQRAMLRHPGRTPPFRLF